MSHFTVLVIGDVKSQLAKYDENIEVPKYSEGLVSTEEKERFTKYYQKEHPRLGETTFDDLYAEFGEDWNSSEWTKNADGEWETFSTYNPKSKWDWYQVGGRWSGFFMLKTAQDPRLQELLDALGMSMGEVDNLARLKDKSLVKYNKTVAKYKGKEDQIKVLVSLVNTVRDNKDNYSDSTAKKNIDFAGMQKKKQDEAIAYYDLVASCFRGGIIPKLDKTWKECLAEAESSDIARDVFHKQSAMITLSGVRETKRLTVEQRESISGFYFDLEDFNCTREVYGQRAFDSAFSTFALVVNGEWYEKGEMGWFGMSTDTVTQEEWNKQIVEMLAKVDDEEIINLVDCHI